MKKILCIILVVANGIILSSCAQSTDENNSSSIKSISSIEESKGGEENKEEISAEKDYSIKDDEKIFSTKQYYLQKLDSIEIEMSNLDSFRAGSTADMRYAAEIEYRRWDDSLNEIYSVIKNKLNYNEMKKLEKEELEWINYKENNAKKCADEFKGGTAESLIYTSRLAELTKERCYYLVNEFM